MQQSGLMINKSDLPGFCPMNYTFLAFDKQFIYYDKNPPNKTKTVIFPPNISLKNAIQLLFFYIH